MVDKVRKLLAGRKVQPERGLKIQVFDADKKGASHGVREFDQGLGREVLAAFVAPLMLLLLNAGMHSVGVSAVVLAAACLVQYAGLIAERWFFFAEARHPQNLYYARVG